MICLSADQFLAAIIVQAMLSIAFGAIGWWLGTEADTEDADQ